MARRFDNNVANYMSRSSVNMGLNGLTECSFGCTLSLHDRGVGQIVALKLANLTGHWSTWYISINAQGIFSIGMENEALNQFPIWDVLDPSIFNRVLRILFTWKRNTITAGDGIVYLDGAAAETSFIANGYSAAYVLEEVSNTLLYGVRGDLTFPLNGDLGWVNVWNRQLTESEAVIDSGDPKLITSGLVSSVEVYPDSDAVLGGEMTINGTLEPISWATMRRMDMLQFPKQPYLLIPTEA